MKKICNQYSISSVFYILLFLLMTTGLIFVSHTYAKASLISNHENSSVHFYDRKIACGNTEEILSDLTNEKFMNYDILGSINPQKFPENLQETPQVILMIFNNGTNFVVLEMINNGISCVLSSGVLPDTKIQKLPPETPEPKQSNPSNPVDPKDDSKTPSGAPKFNF